MSNGNFNSINVKQLNFTGDHILKNGQPTMLAILDASGVGHHKRLCVDNLAVGKGDNDCIDLNYVLDVSGASKLSGFINDSNGTYGGIGQVITATAGGWAWQDPSNGGVTVQSKWTQGLTDTTSNTIFRADTSRLARVGIGNFSGSASQAKATLDVESSGTSDSMRSSFKLGTISSTGVFQNAPFSAMMGDGNSLSGINANNGSSFVLGHDCSLNGWCCAAIGRHNVVNMPNAPNNFGSAGAIALGNYAYAGEKNSGSPGIGDIGFAIGTGTEDGGIPGQPTYSSNNNKFVIDISGNVGIGTNAPQVKLDVSGSDALIHGITVGRGATDGTTTTTSQNTAVGYQALYNNTIGFNNVATGYQALNKNTTGQYNVATGMNALRDNIDGDDNTALGTSALETNISGNKNIAIGNSSLLKNTTGSNNTAVGWSALVDNSGAGNVAVGSEALLNNAFGARNVAIGNSALQNNIVGDNNVAIGYNAGPTTNNLSNTISIGYNAQATISNVCVIGDPNINVGIGTSSPSAKLDVVGDISCSIIRGWDLGSATLPTIRYGNFATGLFFPDSSTIGFSTNQNERMRITSAGNVGIGTTSPSEKLEVDGTVKATSGFVGNVTGNVTGNAGTVTVTAEDTTSATRYLTFVNNTGTQGIKRDTNLHYNPSNNALTAGGFYGTIYTQGQPNITSVGTLTGLTVSNPIAGNVNGYSTSCTGNAATATILQNTRTIGGVSFNGSASIDLPGVNTPGNQNTTGNAATATTAGTVTVTAEDTTSATRYLTFVNNTGTQGIKRDTNLHYNPYNNALTAGSFYGTIYTPAQPNITSVGTLTGLHVSSTIVGSVNGSSASCTGNAATATILQNTRTIGGVSFNGSASIDLPGVNTPGNQNTTGNAGTVTFINNTTDSGYYVPFAHASGTTGTLYYNPTINKSIYFNPNTGSLGIGTNSPSVKLEVVGDISGNGALTLPNLEISGKKISSSLTSTNVANIIIDPSNGWTNLTGDVRVRPPTEDMNPATKQYVDQTATGLKVQQHVSLATTVNIGPTFPPNGNIIVDSTPTTPGSRILVKNQTDPSQNGVWDASAGQWTRSNDFADGENVTGFFVFVDDGSGNLHTGWVVNGADVIVGTSDIIFSQFSTTGDIQAGNGLTKTGETLDITACDSNGHYTLSQPTITNGTIDGTTIGTNSASTGKFTTLEATTSIKKLTSTNPDDGLKIYYTNSTRTTCELSAAANDTRHGSLVLRKDIPPPYANIPNSNVQVSLVGDTGTAAGSIAPYNFIMGDLCLGWGNGEHYQGPEPPVANEPPAGKLDVQGNIMCRGGEMKWAHGTNSIYYSTSIKQISSTQLRIDWSGTLGSASNAELLLLPSGGNVGIGTNAPQAKLHVVGDISCNTLTDASGNIGTSGQVLSSTSSGLSWVNTTEHGPWQHDGSDIYYNTGNVGIGTSISFLEASGNIQSNNITFQGDYAPVGGQDTYFRYSSNIKIKDRTTLGPAPHAYGAGNNIHITAGNGFGSSAQANGGDVHLTVGAKGSATGSAAAKKGRIMLEGPVQYYNRDLTYAPTEFTGGGQVTMGYLPYVSSLMKLWRGQCSCLDCITVGSGGAQFGEGSMLYLIMEPAAVANETIIVRNASDLGQAESITGGFCASINLAGNNSRVLYPPTYTNFTSYGGSILVLMFTGRVWKEVSYTA